MTRLSVNINKIALIRNARNINLPDLVKVAKDCELFGAQGITVHPRPDERHIRYNDLKPLKKNIQTEFNIEGYPSEYFLDLMDEIKPHQVTLVPDSPDQLTSDHGWDCLQHQKMLIPIIQRLKNTGARVSLFLDPVVEQVKAAQDCGTDCIELYTEPYASGYQLDAEKAIRPYVQAYETALEQGLLVNAGHDLNLDNLSFLKTQMPDLHEVSIGHALVTDALYYGLSNTIQLYLERLN